MIYTVTDAVVYDTDHPEVWEIFASVADLTSRDETRWSANLIIEDIRWVKKIGVPAKMVAYYARKFMDEYNLPGFFETRPSMFDDVEEEWIAA